MAFVNHCSVMLLWLRVARQILKYYRVVQCVWLYRSLLTRDQSDENFNFEILLHERLKLFKHFYWGIFEQYVSDVQHSDSQLFKNDTPFIVNTKYWLHSLCYMIYPCSLLSLYTVVCTSWSPITILLLLLSLSPW